MTEKTGLLSKRSSQWILIGIGSVVALIIGYQIGSEVITSMMIDAEVAQLKSRNPNLDRGFREGLLPALYTENTDIRHACLLGKKIDLDPTNVETTVRFDDADRFITKRDPKPTNARIVNCDTREEVTVPAIYEPELSRITHDIPYYLRDGYHVVLFYSDSDESSQLKVIGILNIEMDIDRAIDYINLEQLHKVCRCIAEAASSIIKTFEFKHAGIFGTVSIMKEGKSLSVPKGTQIILKDSTNKAAKIGSKALTNDFSEFILSEPIVSLFYHTEKGIGDIYLQQHTLKIILPSGEEYSYRVNVSEQDYNKVKLWYKGKNPVNYGAVLLYRLDITFD